MKKALSIISTVSLLLTCVSFFVSCGGPADNTPQVKEVTAVTITSEANEIVSNESLTLTVSITPADASDKTVTWSSSNTAVLTVADGVVTAVGASGSAVITVASANGKTDSMEIFIVTDSSSYTGTGVLSAALWYDATVPTSVAKDTSGNLHVGWKDYNSYWKGGLIGSLGTEKTIKGGKGKSQNAGTFSETIYLAEYSSRDQILNRVFNKSTGTYQAASAAWDLSALETEFGAD